jgi:hypothetical protein
MSGGKISFGDARLWSTVTFRFTPKIISPLTGQMVDLKKSTLL